MIRMQVPAPQWLQQTPQGISYAQPTGAAVFTNALRPNPLECGGGLNGFDSWGGIGATSTSSTSDFILLLEKAGYPRLVTETVAEYLARAKARFQEDYGTVVIPAGKDEYWAYAQAFLDHLSAQERLERHRKKYFEDADYRKAVDDEHQRRIDSDPEYKPGGLWSNTSTSDFILLLEKAGYSRFVSETVAEYLARAKARFQEDYGTVVIPAGKDEYWAYAQAFLDHLSAQERLERHRKKYYEDAAYRKAVDDEHRRRIDSDPEYKKWVESHTVNFGGQLPPAPEEYTVAVDSFVVQPTIYRSDDFYATQSKEIDLRNRALFVPRKAALNNVATQPALPQGYVPMRRRPEPGAMVNPYAPNTSYAPVAAPQNLLDQLTSPLVLGGIAAAALGIWWMTRDSKEA